MTDKKWKVTAIISIVVNLLLLTTFITLYQIGDDMLEKESRCAIDICGEEPEATAFDYDEYEEVCYCYNNEAEIIKAKFMR